MFRIPVSGSVLVKGEIGCGKTVMLKSMMSLIPQSSADVTLISPYADEYKALCNAGLIQNQAATTEQAEQVIADIYKTFIERKEEGKNGTSDMRPLYLFIDEERIIRKDISNDSVEHLLELISSGSSEDINVIVGSQRLPDEFVSRFSTIIDAENRVINYRNSPMLVAQ